VKPVTALLPGQTNHRWPQFLPDGRRFLLFALGAANVRGLYQGSLDGTTVHRVSDRESAYWFMPPSHALFARQGALWARRLDGTTPAPEGDFMPVAPKVLVKSEHTGYGAFSSSATGSIAYRGSEGEHQLVWVDRSGRTTSVVGPADDTIAYVADLSSDGRAAAVARNVQGNLDVWLVDTERGGFRRLTIDPAVDGVPVLSPDGRRVIYATDGKADVYEMYERRTDRTDDATLVLETGENKNPTDWSPDGRYILYTNLTSTDNDVLALPLFGDRKPIVVARTSKAEWGGKFSPDSNWVAYSSMETERLEVYIQPFPGPGPKVQVSVGGGWNARWRRDGRELFYLAPDDRVMAVSITTLGPKLEVGSPRPLFTLTATGSRSNYEPSPDGQRFLVLTRVSEPSPITVILNWKAP
jgi:Tol biopolymer transport system component